MAYKGTTALITGASAGLGEEFARQCGTLRGDHLEVTGDSAPMCRGRAASPQS